MPGPRKRLPATNIGRFSNIGRPRDKICQVERSTLHKLRPPSHLIGNLHYFIRGDFKTNSDRIALSGVGHRRETG
jgi:hypothetical protein